MMRLPTLGDGPAGSARKQQCDKRMNDRDGQEAILDDGNEGWRMRSSARRRKRHERSEEAHTQSEEKSPLKGVARSLSHVHPNSVVRAAARRQSPSWRVESDETGSWIWDAFGCTDLAVWRNSVRHSHSCAPKPPSSAALCELVEIYITAGNARFPCSLVPGLVKQTVSYSPFEPRSRHSGCRNPITDRREPRRPASHMHR